MNLSVDNNATGNYGVGAISQQITPNTLGHNKHISMNGLPYEKNNRLTPVNGGSNKAVT